ncbi:hypothetical protein MSAN_00660900 [Mycena sanguinolenta]|uniref:CCZ1/INTU/HSP4 first Longin domain-containing protein n=1 Tax=Mycena sanguinolenta TaxID=230812 RepID=A0A8H6Z5L9_9AGAR|nr:hypothetical protein MSAN_00660900 [Mycena sanguinolenta]
MPWIRNTTKSSFCHSDMSRIAPNLLYLTIYNPTLRPSGPIAPDDEDAEEQAHILFYTSKERAVSRDRMLRQVGLAKALISFSDMFNSDDVCDNVHSQTKRMIMVSPEPDFWIHAGIEIAKTPRQPADKSKGKGKEKTQPLLYDYHEHSVHDVAVRADIMRGYEKFKLRHGSFASILSSLGQEALELQLERFFTVWAWSWNLEDGPEFGEHLGPPLHPMQGSLLPHIDDFSSRLPDEVIAIAVSPPYVIPSTRYTEMSFPPALPDFLLSLLPPPQETPLPPPTTGEGTLKANKALPPPPEPPASKPASVNEGSKTFLGMHLDVHLDMPKWNWLTFGKNSKKPPELLAVTPMNENKGDPAAAAGGEAGAQAQTPGIETDTPGSESTMNFEIDRSALEDAMHSERVPLPIEKAAASADADGRSLSETIVPSREKDAAAETSSIDATEDAPAPAQVEGATESERDLPPMPESESELKPPAEFTSTTVHLASPEDPQTTRRRRLFFLIRERIVVALIDLDDANPLMPGSAELPPLAEDAANFIATLTAAMEDDTAKRLYSVDTLPSATKILQQKDRYALSAAGLAIYSPDFKSRSGHLYAARQLLQASDPAISEVFSRGQNPQHWHVGRRGLGDDGAEEEVYMEVFRKEASLTDVDNALAGVIRKSRVAMEPVGV